MITSKTSVFRLILIFAGGVVLLFLVAPLLNMVLHTNPGVLRDTLNDNEVTGSIWLTLGTSMMATIILAFGAVPLAYLLARYNFRGKRLVSGIIDLPVVIPHSAAGIAVLGILTREALPGKVAQVLGFNLVGNPVGIMVAMAFVSLPFLINTARDGFAEVPVRLEKAALNLGASSARVFFSISLPLARRSIITGLILMFARGMSEFGAVVIVAYHPMITPVLIYERFSTFGLQYARPVAVIFIGVCLVFFIAIRLLMKDRKTNA